MSAPSRFTRIATVVFIGFCTVVALTAGRAVASGFGIGVGCCFLAFAVFARAVSCEEGQ